MSSTTPRHPYLEELLRAVPRFDMSRLARSAAVKSINQPAGRQRSVQGCLAHAATPSRITCPVTAIAPQNRRGGDGRATALSRPGRLGHGGSPYSSAELNDEFAVLPAPPAPPTTRTLPSGSNVAVCSDRNADMFEPVDRNVACAGS